MEEIEDDDLKEQMTKGFHYTQMSNTDTKKHKET